MAGPYKTKAVYRYRVECRDCQTACEAHTQGICEEFANDHINYYSDFAGYINSDHTLELRVLILIERE
jgi:Zn-dependent alcohol dehydrogenase